MLGLFLRGFATAARVIEIPLPGSAKRCPVCGMRVRDVVMHYQGRHAGSHDITLPPQQPVS